MIKINNSECIIKAELDLYQTAFSFSTKKSETKLLM